MLSCRCKNAPCFFFRSSLMIFVRNYLIMPEVGHWMSNLLSSVEMILRGLTEETHSIIVRSSMSRWHTCSRMPSAPLLRKRLLVELSCWSRLTARSKVRAYERITTIWKLESSVKLTTLLISSVIGSSLTLSKSPFRRVRFSWLR